MLYIIIFVIFTLWYIYPDIVLFILDKNLKIGTTETNLTELGLYGDTYGGLNAIFSGLAMAGVFYTVWSNKKEIKKKTFEEHFFQKINLLNNIISDITLTKGRIIYAMSTKEDNIKIYKVFKEFKQEIRNGIKYKNSDKNLIFNKYGVTDENGQKVEHNKINYSELILNDK